MNNRIIMFSGGRGSFAVAEWVKTHYPEDNILLYFTDTKWEDEDLYRFIHEVSDKLKLPMLKHSKDLDPIQLMISRHVMFNSRVGDCSVKLKMEVAMKFIKKGEEPVFVEWYNKHYLKDNNVRENPVLYFGIGFDEAHRITKIRENWQPYEVVAPLIDEDIDIQSIFTKYDIELPRMYKLNFTHNNCKGRCVKAGKGHYKNMYKVDYKFFSDFADIEYKLSQYVGAYHMYKTINPEITAKNEEEMWKWYHSGYKYKPTIITHPEQKYHSFIKGALLVDLKKKWDAEGCNLDLFEDKIGGCGCFVDEYESIEL